MKCLENGHAHGEVGVLAELTRVGEVVKHAVALGEAKLLGGLPGEVVAPVEFAEAACVGDEGFVILVAAGGEVDEAAFGFPGVGAEASADDRAEVEVLEAVVLVVVHGRHEEHGGEIAIVGPTAADCRGREACCGGADEIETGSDFVIIGGANEVQGNGDGVGASVAGGSGETDISGHAPDLSQFGAEQAEIGLLSVGVANTDDVFGVHAHGSEVGLSTRYGESALSGFVEQDNGDGLVGFEGVNLVPGESDGSEMNGLDGELGGVSFDDGTREAVAVFQNDLIGVKGGCEDDGGGGETEGHLFERSFGGVLGCVSGAWEMSWSCRSRLGRRWQRMRRLRIPIVVKRPPITVVLTRRLFDDAGRILSEKERAALVAYVGAHAEQGDVVRTRAECRSYGGRGRA